jgi:galactoside O-acetyltransferase
MTQYERMTKGLIYYPGDAEIVKEQLQYQDRLWEFNQLKPTQYNEKTKYMKEVFAECGDDCCIELPFHANWGGCHVHFGNGIYANTNLTIVDDGHVYVADKVMFGPNVIIATASHPIEPTLRAKGYQYNKDVYIGENAWIGAGAVILPGVHIGKNVIIGAGSIVTKDIPDNMVAVGNPCRILRAVGEHDREYFYKTEKIDWDNINSWE